MRLSLLKIFLIISLCLMSSCSKESQVDVEELTIEQIQSSYRSGSLTSVQLVGSYLKNIEDMNLKGPALRAVIMVNPDALDIAKKLDKERAEGKVRGPMHGIPVLIKDNINTADPMATTAGSLALKNNFAIDDAPLIAALRSSGAIILGKANLSEWANFRSVKSSSGWSGVGGLG